MAAKKRVVVFDFDGVIADSFDLHLSCWKKVLADYGASLPDAAILKGLGWRSTEAARLLVKETGIQADPADVADKKMELFRERAADELKPMSGASEAVKRLSDEFYVAITSSRRQDTVESALVRFGLKDRFDLMLTTDDLGPQDELDDLLKLVFERLKVKPADGVMVDDSRNGLLAAERAGMKSVAFDSNPKFKVDHSMADAVINSLDELQPELLHSVFG